MTRLTTTALSVALLAGIAAAQDTTENTQIADPVEAMTTSIMDRVFGTGAAVTARARAQASQAQAQSFDAGVARAIPVPMFRPVFPLPNAPAADFAMPRAWQIPNLNAMQRMNAVAAKNAPLAFSSAMANGIFDIEAIIPTDDGPKQIELNGTERDVRGQFERLPIEYQRSLAPRLGLEPKMPL